MEYLSQTGINLMLEAWSQWDPNIQNYGFGQLYNENGETKVEQVYPQMWVNPVNTVVGEYSLLRSYQILIFDAPFDSSNGDNINKIVSDSEEIALRLIRFLKTYSEVFDIPGQPTITAFTDKFLDDVCGVIIDITIESNAEYANCEDPAYAPSIIYNNIK